MAEEKPTLVLHLTGGGDPLMFPVAPESRADLDKRLPLMLDHGSVETVSTAEGTVVRVNFAHVAVAYVEDLNRRGKVFGLHRA